MERSDKFWNPYLAGVALGLVLLATFLVMGRGLGASGAANRLSIAVAQTVAPSVVASSRPMAALARAGRGVLDDWLVFDALGGLFGGASRLGFAFAGGTLMGMAARAARGCTSGQALSGGAVLSVGAWVFMLSVFAGGYAFAWFMRRQWR